jgi:hypothetical protein
VAYITVTNGAAQHNLFEILAQPNLQTTKPLRQWDDGSRPFYGFGGTMFPNFLANRPTSSIFCC